MDSNRQYLDELIQENLFSKFKSFDGEERYILRMRKFETIMLQEV